ncbi:PREDICTED: uncharacterized protein LOC105971621 [Erythranthe guttata]|uniref:uncharacterized protein LOC105971621 n=1 Tax=Erythranthe guttata TaxID=4155 RepID=UPI00064E0656|nr:PREDICTED: uncharacterized protein LOC105971621 [Erythranthe guttata]|eukprot:XP_012851928.1 PREDICTED: uncharacterized protein LOC105971621 [Erythranthe guttata]
MQMELPASNSPAIRRCYSKSLPPVNSHSRCGMQCRKVVDISPPSLSRIRKPSRRISASANFACDEHLEPQNFGKKKWFHFVGVGGSGLSALAMLALKQGQVVSGSDIAWSGYMDALKEAGASIYIGHSETNLQGNGDVSSLPDAVVVSSAVPPGNVEISIAKSCGVPVYKRGAWLGKITEDYNLIAVSGSHGKSTTTSMLAYVLKAMGDDLTVVIGAQVQQFSGANVIHGHGRNFVLEADEYDACFLGLSPHVAIVTNVDWEHVDIFRDEDAVIEVFRKFLGQIRTGGHLILNGDRYVSPSFMVYYSFSMLEISEALDDTESLSAYLCSSRYKITTFGMSSYNDWQASSVSSNSIGGCDYKLCHKGRAVLDISLQIPGVHNVLNSLAVIAALSAILGDKRQVYESIHMVKSHLKNFKGVSRRFEFIGAIHGYHIFDDYAHHPTEVRAVLQAARKMFPSKELLVVFQPHTYSRLAAMKSEFASSFTETNRVIITEIYAAREANFWSISGEDLARSITSPPCDFIPCLDNVVDRLVDMVSKDPCHQMVILTLGAGDITTVGRKLLKKLQQIFK